MLEIWHMEFVSWRQRWGSEQVIALGLAVGPAKPHYQLSALESRTWGSQPLTVLYLPGSPLRHGPLSVGSDSEATDHSLTPTPGFGSSLIRQPTRACYSAMWSVLRWLYSKDSSTAESERRLIQTWIPTQAQSEGFLKLNSCPNGIFQQSELIVQLHNAHKVAGVAAHWSEKLGKAAREHRGTNTGCFIFANPPLLMMRDLHQAQLDNNLYFFVGSIDDHLWMDSSRGSCKVFTVVPKQVVD